MANVSNVKVKQGNVLSLSGSSVEITGSTTTVGGNLNVQGTISASVLTISETIVSSSVIHHSGSTRFGDTSSGPLMDKHIFSGSVNIDGAVTATSFIGDGSGLTGLALSGSAVTSLAGDSNISVSSPTGSVTVSLNPALSVTSVNATSFTGSGASLTNLPAGQLTGIVSLANGGTGKNLSSSISSGKLLIGSGSELVVGELVAGTGGIEVVPNSGSITINFTGSAGVSQVVGDSNITITNGTGPIVTASLNLTLGGLTSVSADTIQSNTAAILTGLVSLSVTLVTASYPVVDTDSVLLVDSTGSLTITLPSQPDSGRLLIVKKKTDSVETVTLDGVAVDGESTFDLNGPYQSVTLIAYGNEWFIT